jgi:hypothetical protein
MSATKKEFRKCLVPECDSEGTRRGLCSSCRNAAKRQIDAGHTTEDELIKRQLLLPKGRKGKLAAALDNRRKKESESNVSVSDSTGASDSEAGSRKTSG